MSVNRNGLYLIIITLTITGCVSFQPMSDTRATASVDAAFECALRELNTRGYTLLDANKESRLIRAEKNITAARNALLGIGYVEQITVSAFTDTDGKSLLRVTGESLETRRNSRSGYGTSPKLRDEVKAITRACALEAP